MYKMLMKSCNAFVEIDSDIDLYEIVKDKIDFIDFPEITIEKYNNKENRFCLPQLPQPCKESPKALISRYFSRLLAIFLWQKPIRRGYSNLTQAPIQEADHRHQQGSLHREPLWSSHRHPEVCADLPHNASKTLF